MVALATATVLDVAVASGSLAFTGPVVVRTSLRSAVVGVTTSWNVIQSALTSTVMGGLLIQKYRANTMTVPSSGVACTNYGITYHTPQKTLICRSGFTSHMIRRGRSVSGKVASLTRRDLGDVP